MNLGDSALARRWIPLVCWLIVLSTALLICLKIVGYGFVPPGDARRHVAKPFAGKPYSEILILRPEYVVDHSPGWEWMLGALHKVFNWSEDALMSFSIVSLLLWVLCLPLIWFRRPEAWLAALLAELVANPDLMIRLTQARPFLLTYGLLAAFLIAWSRNETKPRWPKIVLTTLGFALSCWMHGTWYLWAILPLAFFLAGRWRDALAIAGCWVAGTFGGALLTGKPFAFLYGAVFMAGSVVREHQPKWLLVGEFQPADGEWTTLALLAIVGLWARLNTRPQTSLLRQPVVWMIALNWVLGFFASRFWADWGVPSAMVWLAMEFERGLPRMAGHASVKRILMCGMVAVPLYLGMSNDTRDRYTFNLGEKYVDARDPALLGWLPEKGGIFYADTMTFFYNTFYRNPHADWRYAVGFEPALMPADNLEVYRAIHRSNLDPASYEPWIAKMRPQDRLVTQRRVDLPMLEWKPYGTVWIGRLPQLPPAHG